VTVLLAADAVELYQPGALDGHGWRDPGDDGARPVWRGMGSLQLVAGISDARAAEGGGRGPHQPARTETGNLFLPLGSDPADGMTARVRGQSFVLSQVRLIQDPTVPGGGITCWASAVSELVTRG
jgi:hypothetical protein